MSSKFKTPEHAFTAYENWLEKQPLSENTRRTYRTRLRQYCSFLMDRSSKHGDPLADPHARDYAVRDYKTHIKKTHNAKPTTVNLTLAAIDNFYRFLGVGDVNVRREELPKQSPQALEPEEQVEFLRAVERSPSERNRAIAILLFYTGLRPGECAALNMEDLRLSARKGVIVVRSGKGDAYREIPLNKQARKVLQQWLKTRAKAFPDTEESAFFLNQRGQRLSTRSIDTIVRNLGSAADLRLSPHVLRHTCLTNLVRNGQDLVLVAEIAGHKRLETTRRYSLPTAKERAAAMEDIQVEY